MDFPQHFGAYGAGNYIRNLPPKAVLDFSDFSGGYFVATNRESIPDNSSPFAEDMEVTRANRLKRAPGTTLVETFEDRSPEWMFLHGSLDFTAELIFFDAPFMGVKRTGATVWADKGLQDRAFAATNFGGTFIFSDGRKVYSRQSNDGTTITEIEDAPVAQAYASWAGRVWAGMAVIDGNLESLGLVHSAANSDYRDWTGLGAGFELLIDEITAGDRIVALKPMGLDFMAVLLRNSIWVGSRTGDVEVPGDFRPRVPGTGAVNAECCQATQFGVLYLSDNGVEIFDGNSSSHVSLQIDAHLLPLDYSKIRKYRSTYNPITKRYFLHCPDGPTWIYEVENKRWFRRTLTALGSVVLPVQVPFVTWATITGDWTAQGEQEWMDFGGISEGHADVIFLGDEIAESDTDRAIAKEDAASQTCFGETMVPKYELKPARDEKLNFLLTTKALLLEYSGTAAIEMWALDNQGVYDLLVADTLPARSPSDEVLIAASKTGRLAGLQLRLISGDIEVSHVQLQYQQRGPRIETGIGGVIGPAGGSAYPGRSYSQEFTQGAVVPPTGGVGGWTGPGGPPIVAPTSPVVTTTGRYKRHFSVTIPAAVGATYLWDFGDGNISTAASPEHTYAAAGSYTVTVTVSAVLWTTGQLIFGIVVPAVPAPDPVTLYTEAGHTAGRPIDGGFECIHNAGDVWAVFHNGVGTDIGNFADQAEFDTDITDFDQLYVATNAFGGALEAGWYSFARACLAFDGTQVPQAPVSGTLRIHGTASGVFDDSIGDSKLALCVYARPNPALGLLVGGNDYQDMKTYGSVLASDETPLLSSLVNAEHVFTLNAAGLAHCLQAGSVWFALRILCDQADAPPSIDQDVGVTVEIDFHSADAVSIDNRPRLHLEFS